MIPCTFSKPLQTLVAVQVKQTVTRTTVGIRHAELINDRDGCILLTTYITPPIADVLKKMACFSLTLPAMLISTSRLCMYS